MSDVDPAPGWVRELLAYFFPSKNPLDYVGWSSLVGLFAGFALAVRTAFEDRQFGLALKRVAFAVVGFVLAEPALIAAAIVFLETDYPQVAAVLVVLRQIVSSPSFFITTNAQSDPRAHQLDPTEFDYKEASP